jgi:sugar O-acyltransferase (sialic acid O-acetyltransferase NeuD family)
VRKELILIGGGGHCRSCIDVIELTESFNIVGILDVKSQVGKEVLGYEIIGTDDDIAAFAAKKYTFLITIGQISSSQKRQILFNKLLEYDASIATIVSPRAYISKHSNVGEGSIIMHDALINSNANIGKNCIINSKSLIEHDAVIEDHCHISTASIINGGVHVKKGTFFGSNAVSIENVQTTNEDFIKAGALFLGIKNG